MIRITDEPIFMMTQSQYGELRLEYQQYASRKSLEGFVPQTFEGWLTHIRCWPHVTTYALEHP